MAKDDPISAEDLAEFADAVAEWEEGDEAVLPWLQAQVCECLAAIVAKDRARKKQQDWRLGYFLELEAKQERPMAYPNPSPPDWEWHEWTGLDANKKEVTTAGWVPRELLWVEDTILPLPLSKQKRSTIVECCVIVSVIRDKCGEEGQINPLADSDELFDFDALFYDALMDRVEGIKATSKATLWRMFKRVKKAFDDETASRRNGQPSQRGGRTAKPEDVELRNKVHKAWSKFKAVDSYKKLGYTRATYENFCKWSNEHCDDLPLLEPDKLRELFAARRTTPSPSS